MASTSRNKGILASLGDEDFLVDLLAKLFGYGCAWIVFCFIAVCTAWAVGMIILIGQMVSN